MRFNNLQDFLAGLLFVAFGAAALWFGKAYAFGAATRMGPGYLPNVLGWMLVGIGALHHRAGFAGRRRADPAHPPAPADHDHRRAARVRRC